MQADAFASDDRKILDNADNCNFLVCSRNRPSRSDHDLMTMIVQGVKPGFHEWKFGYIGYSSFYLDLLAIVLSRILEKLPDGNITERHIITTGQVENEKYSKKNTRYPSMIEPKNCFHALPLLIVYEPQL
jgi:hypothetical protein